MLIELIDQSKVYMRNGKIRRFRPRSKHHSRRSNVKIQNNGKHINGHSNHSKEVIFQKPP